MKLQRVWTRVVLAPRDKHRSRKQSNTEKRKSDAYRPSQD